MLWIWAATSIIAQAVILHPNETVFNDFCKKSTTCEVLKYNTCLGSPLPYTHTSLILAEDSETQEEALEKLAMWSGKLLFYYVIHNYYYYFCMFPFRDNYIILVTVNLNEIIFIIKVF